MQRVSFRLIGSLFMLLALGVTPLPVQAYLQFDQTDDNKASVEIRSHPDLSVSTNGGLTISVWIRPDTPCASEADRVCFTYTQSTGYVNWLGKGQGEGLAGQQEWTFRMYSWDNTDNPHRKNRISFYVFNPQGGQGVGSYFEEPFVDPVRPGDWIHVVGVVDNVKTRTYIYRNGLVEDCDQYGGKEDGEVIRRRPNGTTIRYRKDPLVIEPRNGDAPLRIGTRDHASYFQGAIGRIRIWSRALTQEDVWELYNSGKVPQELVAEYLLGENAGDKAHDTVRAGTISGATWGAPDPGP